jgi:phosphohistidine phosphatase
LLKRRHNFGPQNVSAMRYLFLIRHAKSSWDAPSLRDFDRPLNERGGHDAPRMAKLLFQKNIRPDLIVSSPAKRALTTARFFAEGLGIPPDSIVQKAEIYDAFATDILQIIQELPDHAQTVFLFGHNPTFTDVANRFADQYIGNIPTCGVVCIESTAPGWADFNTANARVIAQLFPKEVL